MGHNDYKSDVIICAVLILMSVCCLFILNVFENQNRNYQNNLISSKYLELIIESSNNQLITLDNLKKSLSFKLLKAVHSPEFYNGVPLTNDTIQTTEPDKTGWFGLYNSRLIGGGIQITQNRVDRNGENDNKNYGSGWKEYATSTDYTITTSWTYSRPQKNATADEKNNAEGYGLYLTDRFVESKWTLDEHLGSKWLDTRTRSLSVQFQIYTPNTDTVTVVKIRAKTGCGLLYAITIDLFFVLVVFVMADLREQRVAVKFCFLPGKTGTEILEMLKTAFKGVALGKTQVFEWFSRFKSEKIHKIIMEDRWQTIEEVVERSSVTWNLVQRILSEDLGIRRVAANFVPRLLTEQQKQGHVETCSFLKEEFQNDPNFFSKVITGDES
ncbi:Polycystin cation channel, PKD1/PKD2 [Cinara cedri]|uniref:Polycystin cation channel, PKD1/PKD2 n=1 Tax=Cinara cedri TaxID=506608 RepID=A0A5E4MY75_9HEMI|nr:Polycystin cation channel, PKD1/PKD2 [Cinara cedri]